MRQIILELPIDKFTKKAIDTINNMKFDSLESLTDGLKSEVLLYEVGEFVEGVNNDMIDTENNWFATVTILN